MSDKKQKVLIVHNYYQIPGGEDTVVANEKKMLETHGHEVVLYTRHNSELKSFSKLRKIMLPFSTIFNIRTYREVKRIIKEQRIDLIHVHNTLNLVSPSVYYAAFHCHVPVVQTVHNFRIVCPGATFFRDGHVCEECLTKGLACAVRYGCYRNSKAQSLVCVVAAWAHRLLGTYGKLNYICLTEFNKEKLLTLKQIKETQVYVKPNFVQEQKKIVPLNKRKNQFVYVGRLEEIKGTEVLLNAWKILGENGPKLLVCGKGPMEEWCRQYVEKHHLAQVEFLGFVTNEKVRELVGNSKALILPTQVYEGFPMTIAEAYACGTPVIGSDLGNTGSLIIDGVSGFKFSHQSPGSLAETISLADKQLENLDIDKFPKFDVENNYKQLRSIYETCCNHNEYSGTV